MTAPTDTLTSSSSLDQTIYAPGQTASLTVDYTDTATVQVTVTTVVKNDSTGAESTSTATFAVNGDTFTISDTAGHVWAQASNDGSTAVFTTTV